MYGSGVRTRSPGQLAASELFWGPIRMEWATVDPRQSRCYHLNKESQAPPNLGWAASVLTKAPRSLRAQGIMRGTDLEQSAGSQLSLTSVYSETPSECLRPQVCFDLQH